MSKYSINKLPNDVLISTADKVRKIRKSVGYSQINLAKRSDVSLGSIKRFETTGQISLQSLLKILFVLKRLDEFESILKQDDDIKNIENLFSKK